MLEARAVLSESLEPDIVPWCSMGVRAWEKQLAVRPAVLAVRPARLISSLHVW